MKSFSGQLYVQYAELAMRKQAEGNAAAAAHFNDKSKRAAAGGLVLPDRSGDAAVMGEYDLVRKAIGEDVGVAPAVRARAQVMFDCWLNERAENVNPGDIRACRQELDRALAILDTTQGKAGAGTG